MREENTMKTMVDLKDKLYEILLSASNGGANGDVSVNQELGVKISKAVQKDGGVNIIQLQSTHIHSITEKVVEALKVADAIEVSSHKEPELIDISPSPQIGYSPEEGMDVDVEVKTNEEDPAVAFWEFLYHQRMGWKAMQEYCKDQYSMFIRDKQPTVKDGAEFLGLNKAYFGRLTGGKSDDKRTGTGIDT